MIRTEFGVGDPTTWREAPDNARTHSAAQVKKLRRIIDQFGPTNPVILDEKRELIAGHGRKAACLLKPALVQFPEITIHGLTEAQKKALRLADNRVAEDAGWDNEKLAEVLKALQADDFDLDFTGFDGTELSRLLGPASGDTDPDDVPDVPVKAVSEAGDIWELGGHRLACGDATDAATVEAVLGGVQPGLMVTDPPYGVEYKPLNRGTGQEGWERAEGIVMNDDRSDWREAWALCPSPVAYVWHAMKTADTVLESLRACDFTLSSQIVWKKTSPVMSPANRTTSGGYNPQHECCYYVVRKGQKAGWKGDRSQSTVWEIDHLKNETGHGTQKPVECMSRPIMNNSSPGQAVYDPFMGSGTTIIACEQTDRVAYGVELNPAYVDVAVTRWQKFSGKVAILMDTGETFTEVMARRHPDTQTPERVVKPARGAKK